MNNTISYLEILGVKSINKVLIFLPGLGAYKENYIDFSKSFSNNYKSIYILDLPEQGSKGEWTIGNMVDNLKEFINRIDQSYISEIHLAGHSAGALAIVSFLCNMNTKVEEKLMQSRLKSIDISSDIMAMGFGQIPKEAKKVTKLFLYSPCDSFANVFPKFFIKRFIKLSESKAMRIMNILINKPSYLLKLLTFKRKFNFQINLHNKPQYFGLVLNNHKTFFKYIYNYRCIFEIKEILNLKLEKQISDILNAKRIVLQFGRLDWLLISKNRCKKQMLSNFKICENIVIIEHKKLGHFLHKPFSLDLNLNNQMLINKNVIKMSLSHIV
ncbi:alpha/beta hydrolase [uncultured Algibacter sp.]|uniref:alpha/beta hydrolase n=1 Tax=uncultured Algibacter sp. TaxID=298659 RepID=UPI002607C7C4|nr:alpha/beta hydrolase [uncultured Algibacter sp.]